MDPAGARCRSLHWHHERVSLGKRARHEGWRRWPGAPYLRAVGNLCGWSDGDPFYRPSHAGNRLRPALSRERSPLQPDRIRRRPRLLEGQVTRGRLGLGLSEEFEIGLLSEASIGHIPVPIPAAGIRHHVVTPAIGLAWMLDEDALDRYLIRPVEDRTGNKWARLAHRAQSRAELRKPCGWQGALGSRLARRHSPICSRRRTWSTGLAAGAGPIGNPGCLRVQRSP